MIYINVLNKIYLSSLLISKKNIITKLYNKKSLKYKLGMNILQDLK